MDPTRRVAVAFDPGPMDWRQRETLRGVARHAEAAGWHVAIDPYAPGRQGVHCEGIIATSRKWRGPKLAGSPVPVVLVSWGHVRQPELVRVVENRYAAGRMAARHLVERGYGTFAYVGFSSQSQSAIERVDFTKELRRLGRKAASARTFVTYASSAGWWDKVMAMLGEWLGRLKGPAGLLVARPRFARALADLALARDLRIPEDVGIVAADNDPVVCELAPPLTSIHCDYAEVGRRAAELLEGLMDGARPPHRAVLVEPTLVPRLSTDREGAADPLIAKALWFIDSHRTEPLRPCHVGAAVGLSPRALAERMRRARGRTVLEEITRARVEHAKLQLDGSHFPLRAVAHECGFGSYEAMLVAFRRHVGMPPSAWRRQAQLRRRGSPDAEEHRRRPSRTRRPDRDA